ncbi:MAG: YciI family protein [Devosia sp.]
MQYLLMIYADDSYAKMTPEEGKAMGEAYAKYTQDIVQSGHLKGGDRVKPPSTARTIRRGGGKAMTTDGPFAETREQLAGYYLIEANDLDEATKIAGRIPFTAGAVEVRPVDTASRMY